MPMKTYASAAPPPDGAPASPTPGAAQPTAAPATNPVLAALILQVEATRFDPANPPPPEPWVFKLAGVEIAHPGNLVTITAAVKAGKSSAFIAMLASLFGPQNGDYLGFAGRNPDGKTVLHFDTEQSRGDHHAMMMIGLRRAGMDAPPAWLKSYSLVRHDPGERRAVIMEMARRAAANGGLLAVFIDGVADTAFDVNETAEACSLVADLHQLASETACVIVAALHHNPGSEKSRGHLGSQLERKSESVLVLRKADGVISITCQPARHEEVSGDKSPCFTWDAAAGMHVTAQSKAATKDEQKRADLAELADEIFAGKTSLRWKELQAAIKQARGGVNSTIEGKIKDMKRLGVIRSAEFGHYTKGTP